MYNSIKTKKSNDKNSYQELVRCPTKLKQNDPKIALATSVKAYLTMIKRRLLKPIHKESHMIKK